MVLEGLMMEVIIPLCHPELPKRLGVRPTGGILLHGPPGSGKTMLAYAIANETGLPFYKISAIEVVSAVPDYYQIMTLFMDLVWHYLLRFSSLYDGVARLSASSSKAIDHLKAFLEEVADLALEHIQCKVKFCHAP
ncbi:hypothetical protein M5K25_016927 [Dendrobium thyrsiflorum]|uniref:ATPase AAA-type core domain-containing protein n=1 Tax=Dendrobium thyrsiflorum TaxID=117978 RepID=A0ABD0ULF5_DENTH